MGWLSALNSIGDAIIEFGSYIIPGLDTAYTSIQRLANGDPMSQAEAEKKAEDMIGQLYAKVMGNAPKAPSDAKVLNAEKLKRHADDIKNKMRGSLAARGVVRREAKQADQNYESARDEYSAALDKYNKDLTTHQKKVAEADALASEIRITATNPDWGDGGLSKYEQKISEL